MAVGVGVLEVVVINKLGMVELVIIGAAVVFGLWPTSSNVGDP